MCDNISDYQWNKSFDATKEAEEVLRVAKLRKRKRFKRSVLDQYRAELVALYSQGLSISQLALWLLAKKRLTVSRSTIYRRLQSWPEVEIRHKGGRNG